MKNLNLTDLDIKIVKSARSKSLRLKIDRDGNVILSMPKWVSKRIGLKFIQNNLEWIQNQQSKVIPLKQFKDNMTIEILGQSIIICHNAESKGATKIENGYLFVSGQEAHLHRRVRDFIKRLTLPYIQEKSIEMAKKLGEKPLHITLKDTSSRWGSCSSKKHLNFCWKLALSPKYVLDYIIAHEVSHLKEMNHGDKFWATVASLGVQRANAEIWLRKYGSELQAWE